MRRTALLTSLLLCCLASYAFATGDEFGIHRPVQPKGYGDAPQPAVLSGGDTFATATVIPALPYADGGNTCTFTNDYDPPCASETHTARDVVYSFSPTANVCVDISLCGSGFDTELVVYQNNVGTVVACQDDSPDCSLQSHLTGVALTAGNTYYIVVDGYAAACGNYTLNVTQCPPPPVCSPCPAVATLEGEPVCSNGYVDNYNGGCNSVPPVVTSLLCEPSVTVCGTYGTFDLNGSRDTDWYQVTVDLPTTINASVNGHGLTGSALAIIDTACPPNLLCGQFNPTAECATVTCSAAVAPGTYRIFVASFFDNTPCGSTYVLSLSGLTCQPVATHSTSWGTLKGLYR
jgi:hypothetical protein